MSDLQLELANRVYSRLGALGLRPPSLATIQAIIRVAYLASLKTEEGRFVRGSLTYADPRHPEVAPYTVKRAGYPEFHKFGAKSKLTVPVCVKFCRAIDGWSGSVAVHGTGQGLFVWGVVDQLVSYNTSLQNEPSGLSLNPGLFCVSIDNVAELTVYHNDTLLGALKRDRLILREREVFAKLSMEGAVFERISQLAEHAASALVSKVSSFSSRRDTLSMELEVDLSIKWEQVGVRLCVGIRRSGTGGALILTPECKGALLSILHPIKYRRLEEAMVLSCLDGQYLSHLRSMDDAKSRRVWRDYLDEISLAEEDADDRERELTGAVKMVASLATVDGLVLMSPLWSVVGFGVKIKSSIEVGKVYVGADYVRRKRRARLVDTAQFGTRHTSMLRYCREDSSAIGIVISQDGDIRVIATMNGDLVLWDDVKILRRRQDVGWQRRQNREVNAARQRNGNRSVRGLTSMPKTLVELERYK